MEHKSMEQIIDVYEKLGLPTTSDIPPQDSRSGWGYSSFGIYVEDGFNFSNNTNSTNT